MHVQGRGKTRKPQGSFNFNLIEFVACTMLIKSKKKRKEKVTLATGAENRTMSQLIFNPNQTKNNNNNNNNNNNRRNSSKIVIIINRLFTIKLI